VAPAIAALLVVAAAFVADGPAAALPHDVLVTDDHSGDTYVRADGQPSAITDLCGSSRQAQEEPSVAIDPNDPRVVVVGANDACGARFGSDWVGFYRSDDGGSTWSRSLVPGFVEDSSDEGIASPVHRECESSSDPALSFDRTGTLFFGFLCAGANSIGKPTIFVASYADDGARYTRTVTIENTDSVGFEDKPTIGVDATGAGHDGSVYAAWTDFGTVGGRPLLCQAIMFTRSRDHGASFGPPRGVSGEVCATGRHRGRASRERVRHVPRRPRNDLRRDVERWRGDVRPAGPGRDH
jgi:hypothetical protein